jgi:lipopolysaccharide biosynthesis regulator YciM
MTVLFFVVIALIAIILYMYFHRRREQTTAFQPYLESLIALLDNDDDLAVKKLKEAVSVNSDLFDAYLRLGDMYRKKGDTARALQIHQSLTARPTLKKHEEKKVYFALAQDALAASRPNRAISFLKEILKIDKKDINTYNLILKTYEDMESYSDCISIYEEGTFKPKSENRRAFYYAALAHDKMKKVQEGDSEGEKDIINLLRKSLRIAPESITGMYYMGNLFERLNELKKAYEYYSRIVDKHPGFAFLIIPHLEKVSFELGSFNEIIPIYENIVTRDPRNFSVGFALADVYEKKNDVDAARALYFSLAELFPRSVLPKIRLLKLRTDDEAILSALDEIENTIGGQEYRCSNCGNVRSDFTFLCEQCHAIESFSPVL